MRESLQEKRERWNREIFRKWQVVRDKVGHLSFNTDDFWENTGKNHKKKEKIGNEEKLSLEKVLPQEVKKTEEVVQYPTEILKESRQGIRGKLVYRGIHGCGDLVITGEVFLLGKSTQQADGIIEAEGVSRLHARITRQEDVYYIEDLNSTNGTYLNETPLEYCQKKELCRNDCIRFGAEEYVFY